MTTSKEQLEKLIAVQFERAKQFAFRFDALVKRTLTNDYKGVVDIEENGVNVRIVRGESLSGEAYETLAILLADLALLFESLAEHSHHPGILIHDSPREADLNLGIYRRLLDMAEEFMRDCGQRDELSYPYIVTTTTLPSKTLQKKEFTKPVLGGGERSLFKKQLVSLTAARTAPTLFDNEEEA